MTTEGRSERTGIRSGQSGEVTTGATGMQPESAEDLGERAADPVARLAVVAQCVVPSVLEDLLPQSSRRGKKPTEHGVGEKQGSTGQGPPCG